jgi:hypothetical protein
MKLYEITGELRAQLERMANEEQSPEEAAQCLRELSGEFKDKINAVVSFALELQATAKARTDAAKRMADGAKALTAKADALLDYAQISIENVAHPMPMRLPNFTINLAKMPPKSDVFNDAIVPFEYRTRVVSFTIKPDVSAEQLTEVGKALADLSLDTDWQDSVRKTDVLADLKAGVIIEGARLEPVAYRLTVK